MVLRLAHTRPIGNLSYPKVSMLNSIIFNIKDSIQGFLKMAQKLFYVETGTWLGLGNENDFWGHMKSFSASFIRQLNCIH